MLSILGVYIPKMKGANWLKSICHQGRSLVNIFSLCNNWYRSVVLLLIWLHSLVCQIHNKQMSQLVAYRCNICVWLVSCNECGGCQLGRQHKYSIRHMQFATHKFTRFLNLYIRIVHRCASPNVFCDSSVGEHHSLISWLLQSINAIRLETRKMNLFYTQGFTMHKYTILYEIHT